MAYLKLFLSLLLILGLTGCLYLEEDIPPPMQFEVQGEKLVLHGVVFTDTLDLLKEQLAQNPQVDTLVLANVPGSADDEYNLLLAKFVRESGLNTHVPAGGLIASGGTDLFLAGVQRSIDNQACIGVHSWADNYGEEGNLLPKDHKFHKPYLEYFKAIGISPDFYWYTLDAASADDMYWMSKAEMNRFAMTSNTLSLATVEPNDIRQQRCDAIPDVE